MTEKEIEVIRLKRLISEIQADLEALEKVCSYVSDLYGQIQEEPTVHQKMAMGGYLHHFYVGIESIHQRIAQAIEGDIPGDEGWHRALLMDMSVELSGIRPRIISPETRERLSDYLGFRHVFRHIYTSELEWNRLEPLSRQLRAVFDTYRSEIEDFLSYLQACISALEKG